MKAKKILTLASIFAGAAVVGTTFAAWAVTDNADPFGIKVSPGQIKSDETEFVTLSYGERVYADVSNLEEGKPRLGAKVNLKVETSKGHAYTGKFKMTLINQTSKEAGKPLLIEYLNVDVYDVLVEANEKKEVTTDLSKLTPKGHIPVSGDSPFTTDVSFEVASGAAGKDVYVVVSLAGDDIASVLQDIKDDVVFLQMDWNSNGTDEVKASKIFFENGSEASHPIYCYAWADGKVNAQFPGAEMHHDGSGVYSYDLSMDYENLLFVEYDASAAEGSKEVYKTANLTIDTTGRVQAPSYNKSSKTWGPAPVIEDLNFDWYVVGDKKNSWKPTDDFGMTSFETSKYHSGPLQFAAGEKIKVVNKARNDWRSSKTVWDDCGFTLDDEGNVVITNAGVYTVTLDLTQTGSENYVSITQATPNA